jgi:uncharacterized glyoxalase superfamily protein PhnB/DNA-binding XRE family transcriptional regulator
VDQKATGQRIKRLRDQKAWTQEHLAQAAEVSVRTVQRAEDGVMSAETLSAIAGALDEPVEALSRTAPRYPSITPILFYDDPASIDWLVDVLGLKVRMRIPGSDGRVVHGELTLGDGLVMVATPIEREKKLTPKRLDGAVTQTLYVMVPDADAHYERTRAAGATIVDEPADAHGHRRYRLADPEGHLWWFVHDLS